MTEFTFEFGELRLRVSERSLVFVPPGSRDGRHLTIYLRPQETGRHAGFYTPHVTFPKRGDRRTIGRFQPAQLARIWETYQQELVTLWLSASRPTTLERLAADDWCVLGWNDAIESRVHQLIFPEQRLVRLPLAESDWQDIVRLVVEHSQSPTELSPEPDAAVPRFMIRFGANDVEQAMLAYYPNGLAGPPGWYVTRQDEFTFQVTRRLLMRDVSRGFVQAMLRLSTHLGICPSNELLELSRAHGLR